MREILFRGKRLDNGEWVEGDLVKNSIIDCFTYVAKGIGYKVDDAEIGKPIKVFPSTVGQFTGLTDKNGKKIFEGDICTRSPYGMPSYKTTFSVHYHNLHCAFIIADDDGRVKTWLHEITNTHDVEVVGNIHDNPELGGDT